MQDGLKTPKNNTKRHKMEENNDKIELFKKILIKSESIGRWREFLSKIEDWSSVSVTIGQNNVRKLENERQKLIMDFFENNMKDFGVCFNEK